jgi:hypothetical protein
MAIQNTVVVNGVSGNYWKTTQLYFSPDYTQCRATLTLYQNMLASVSGPALTFQEVVFSPSSNPAGIVQLANIVESSLVGNSAYPNFYGGSVVPGK